MGNTKLGFMNVPNGDVIAFDMKESEINPSVVYLSHDDGEGHGYILGKDFNTYLEQLLLVEVEKGIGGMYAATFPCKNPCHPLEHQSFSRCRNRHLASWV